VYLQPEKTATETLVSLSVAGSIITAGSNSIRNIEVQQSLENAWTPLSGDGMITFSAGKPSEFQVKVNTGVDANGISDTLTLQAVTGDVDVVNKNTVVEGTTVVLDRDSPTDVIRIDDAMIGEGGILSFAVHRDALSGDASSVPLFVDFATATDLSADHSDFEPTSGVLTFQATSSNQNGATEKYILVPTKRDAMAEQEETMTLVLSNPRFSYSNTLNDVDAKKKIDEKRSVVLAKGSAEGVIRDNGPGGWPGSESDFSASDATVYEGLPLSFVISRNPASMAYAEVVHFHTAVMTDTYSPSASSSKKKKKQQQKKMLPVIINLATTELSNYATSDDFVARSGAVLFLPGEINKTVTVETVVDSQNSGAEIMQLVVTSPYDDDPVTVATAMGTILDSLPTPAPSMAREQRGDGSKMRSEAS
jgi:hypothetical protein